MTVYIYGLRCPVAGQIRYIGKSIDPTKRYGRHIGSARRGEYNHHTANWIRNLLSRGLVPELCVLEEVKAGERWQDVERHWIAIAERLGWPLTNSTRGGEGLDYIDPADAESYKKNLSRAMKELWNRPERVEQARARSIAAWSDPEIRAKRIESVKAAYKDEELLKRMSEINRNIGARPEVKAAKSTKMQNQWQRVEYRDVIVAARNDPEFVKFQSERLRLRWQDPAHRQKMQDSRWTPEKRAEQAKRVTDPLRLAKIKSSRNDPDVKERQRAALKANWARRKAAKAAID